MPIRPETSGGPESVARRRVLVCDDERHIVRLVQVVLERHGHEVSTAFSGLEAIHKLKTEEFDALILDVLLPGIDGFEILKYVRRDAGLTNLPVIMITAKTSDHDVFQGYQFGADMYLTKPFNPIELLEWI